MNLVLCECGARLRERCQEIYDVEREIDEDGCSGKAVCKEFVETVEDCDSYLGCPDCNAEYDCEVGADGFVRGDRRGEAPTCGIREICGCTKGWPCDEGSRFCQLK